MKLILVSAENTSKSDDSIFFGVCACLNFQATEIVGSGCSEKLSFTVGHCRLPYRQWPMSSEN